MNTNVTGPLDWGVIEEFARANDRTPLLRPLCLAWMKTIPLVLPCAKCRGSSEAMVHLKPPENEFMEGRALAYVHELKSFVNDKLGRGERTIELEVLQKRAAVWKQFVSFEALIDVLGLKILNMAQRPEPLPRVHYTHMIMTLQLAFVAYKVPNCPSLKCRRLKFCSRPQGPRLVGSLLTWPKKTRSNGSRGCGLPLPTQKT